MDVWICYASTSQEEKEEEILTGLVYIQGILQQPGTFVSINRSKFGFGESRRKKIKQTVLWIFIYALNIY
jgi:hypothetical protein